MPDKFTELLKKLVRVPKEEIDAEEKAYQEREKSAYPAKPGEIVPPVEKARLG